MTFQNYSADGMQTRLYKAVNNTGVGTVYVLTGIPKASLISYTEGKTIPTADKLAKICKACNVSADWVLFGIPETIPNEWISVFEETPKESGYYLVKDKYGCRSIVAWRMDGHWIDEAEEEITHWARMPEEVKR